MIILWAFLGLVVSYILLLWISSLFVNTGKEYTKDSPYYRWLLNSATGIMMFFLRICVRATGIEKIPDGRFLLVSNHRSNFDPLLNGYIFRKQNIAFISKKENLKIPIFGRIIRRCCFLAIDRENPRNALVTINKAANLIKENVVSIGIYPEGARSKECVLLPFHAGVLKTLLTSGDFNQRRSARINHFKSAPNNHRQSEFITKTQYLMNTSHTYEIIKLVQIIVSTFCGFLISGPLGHGARNTH